MAIGRVALVHDYLNQRGGAERVALALARIWPHAPLYTSLFRPDSTWPGFADCDVRTSFLDRVPVDTHFRWLFPLYPSAFAGFGEIDADVVVASSSAWGHIARSRPGAFHAVYCHTPARWLYGRDYLRRADRSSRTTRIAQPLFGPLRLVDQAAAKRADLYIANSENVRRRIAEVYGIDAAVIHPPVDITRFRPSPRGERLLVISRLLPYKHVDLVIRAAGRLGVGLDVVGEGPARDELEAMAGSGVRLHGMLDDAAVTALMESCRAVVVAAEEDFGIVAVEAQAAGKPVIAYGRGGSLETVVDGVTGVLFDALTESALIGAIHGADALDTPATEIAARAQQFSTPEFRRRMLELLESRASH